MYKLFTDGGSRGNPGPAAIGCVIWKDEVLEDLDMKYIGIATNNIAEYKALALGIAKLKRLGADQVEIYMDSELVVKQINGEYAVKNSEIKIEYSKIKVELGVFGNVRVIYVPREQNKVADRLVNLALDLSNK